MDLKKLYYIGVLGRFEGFDLDLYKNWTLLSRFFKKFIFIVGNASNICLVEENEKY